MPKLLTTFLPMAVVACEDVLAGMPLAALPGLASAPGPVVCALNGSPVLRGAWPDTIIQSDDVVTIINLPQGDGESDPARIIATIGVMALSIAAPQMASPAWGLLEAGKVTFLGAMVSAGIAVGGSYLINAILPIKMDAGLSGGAGGSDTSTTYSLSNPTNTARIGDVIPVQYGTMRRTPALAAAPWFEFDDTDRQWAYILLDMGHGLHDVSKIEFDCVDADTLGDSVEYSVLDPGDTVPWHDNVYTSPNVDGGEEVKRLNSYEKTSTGTIFCIPASGGEDAYCTVGGNEEGFYAGDEIRFPEAALNTGTFTIKSLVYYSTYFRIYIQEDFVSESITGTVLQANDYTSTNEWPVKYRSDLVEPGRTVYCDVVFPSGVYKRNTDGTIEGTTVTLRLYCGDTAISDAVSITRSQREPVRVSIEGTLPSSGSDLTVHVRRYAAEISDFVVDVCYWAGLRVVYDDVGSYQTTTIPIRVVASEGLSQAALTKIRVTSTIMLPIYNDTTETWSVETATRSIAWAAADVCRNEGYSVGAADARIDLEALVALDAVWTARGDYCDGVFEGKGEFWDRLNQVLRCGRAQAHMVGNMITFTRDQSQTAYRAVFTPNNIKAGTFTVEPVLYDPETPDDIDAEYFDADTWTWKSVRCTLPGSTSEAPAKKRYWGVTDAAQAEREGLYDAACNQYRRLFVSFTTQFDARIVLRGHLVSVTYPQCDWGQSGEVMDVDGTTLTLSEPVEFGTGNHYITFRDRFGGQDGPYHVSAGDTDYEVLVSLAVPSHVTTDINLGRTRFQFGEGENFHKPCLVVGCKPRGNGEIDLALVVENDAVHTADGAGV